MYIPIWFRKKEKICKLYDNGDITILHDGVIC